ncbi:MAG: SET domain-containing protein-lysine N-methyltransferase [Gemmatimonadaceae bacterium]
MRTGSTPRVPFVLAPSPIAGRGAFAIRAIRKGERIIEYKGERITWAEADLRYPDDVTVNHHTFLFAIDDDVVVDAALGGNAARFINHSCAPNCDAVIDEGRIYIEAIRPIAAGDELCYDYAYELDVAHTAKQKKLYPCRCGARRCRGTILARKREPRKREPRKRPTTRRR